MREVGGLEWISGKLTSDAKVGGQTGAGVFKPQEKKQGPVSKVFRPLATGKEAKATTTASFAPVTQPRPGRIRSWLS